MNGKASMVFLKFINFQYIEVSSIEKYKSASGILALSKTKRSRLSISRYIKALASTWGSIKKAESPEIRRSLPVPIYVFHDSEQKFEFEARIKPCSHQPNCMDSLEESRHNRPAVHRLLTGCSPAARHPTDRPSAVDRQSTGCSPAVDRPSTGCSPAVDRPSTGCSPTVDRLPTGRPPAFDRPSTGCPPAPHRLPTGC